MVVMGRTAAGLASGEPTGVAVLDWPAKVPSAIFLRACSKRSVADRWTALRSGAQVSWPLSSSATVSATTRSTLAPPVRAGTVTVSPMSNAS
jgi:hypothetical protein